MISAAASVNAFLGKAQMASSACMALTHGGNDAKFGRLDCILTNF